MSLINAFAIVLFISLCSGFERDENFHINDDKNILNCFFKRMNLSEYKMPPIDTTGFIFNANFTEHIHECAKTINDSIDLDYIEYLSPKVLELQPPFDLSGHRVSEKCRRSSREFVKSLKNFEFWALKSKSL